MCSIANEDEFAFMSRGNRCSEEEGPLFDFFRFSVVQICKSSFCFSLNLTSEDKKGGMHF